MSPKETATDIVTKAKSPFVDEETLTRWIESAIIEAMDKAKRDEHDRIERLIAKKGFTQLKEMQRMARFKHGQVKVKRGDVG